MPCLLSQQMPPASADQRIGGPEQPLDMGPHIIGLAKPFIAHGRFAVNDAGDFAMARPGLPPVPCLERHCPSPRPAFGREQRHGKASQPAERGEAAQGQYLRAHIAIAGDMESELDRTIEQRAGADLDADTAGTIGNQDMLAAVGVA